MKIDVAHVAKLANLPLTDEEKKKFEKQLSSILEYIAKLNEVDTKNIEPTSQVTGLENVTREDITAPSFTQDEALSNTTSKHNGLFKVPAILES
ncbi:MAG: Asp-tRNA(Asn)/Glu-tRNA(Gln) amidotransferase subunit GatC [Candidatus Levyibacteriota bacterium]|nr:MAG: Asp-tRNA(Asn)/Glu-tRNA(Gln) amidotransferase subunit GatC [Candidatus Levybacteria bacterium]